MDGSELVTADGLAKAMQEVGGGGGLLPSHRRR